MVMGEHFGVAGFVVASSAELCLRSQVDILLVENLPAYRDPVEDRVEQQPNYFPLTPQQKMLMSNGRAARCGHRDQLVLFILKIVFCFESQTTHTFLHTSMPPHRPCGRSQSPCPVFQMKEKNQHQGRAQTTERHPHSPILQDTHVHLPMCSSYIWSPHSLSLPINPRMSSGYDSRRFLKRNQGAGIVWWEVPELSLTKGDIQRKYNKRDNRAQGTQKPSKGQ